MQTDASAVSTAWRASLENVALPLCEQTAQLL